MCRPANTLKPIIVGVVFIVAALAVPAAIVIPVLLPYITGEAGGERFKVPGTVEVTVEEPGRYYLWNEHRTVFGGKTYNRSNSIPDGMKIRITRARSGEPFEFVGDTSISSSSGSSSKRTIGYIEVKEPGRVEVAVTGGEEERVFSFARFRLWETLGLILGGLALAFVLGVTGFGIAVWGIVKLVRSRQSEEDIVPAVVDDAAR